MGKARCPWHKPRVKPLASAGACTVVLCLNRERGWKILARTLQRGILFQGNLKWLESGPGENANPLAYKIGLMLRSKTIEESNPL